MGPGTPADVLTSEMLEREIPPEEADSRSDLRERMCG